MTDFKFKCGSCRNFEPKLGTVDAVREDTKRKEAFRVASLIWVLTESGKRKRAIT